MKQFLIALFIVLALGVPVFATEITVAAHQIPGYSPSNLGQQVSVTATVANGSANVTSSAAFRTQWVGLSGFRISINGTFYYVSYVSSTSALVLSSNYTGSSGSATVIFYPYVEARLYSSISFYPNGSSNPVLPGAPNGGPAFRRYAASVINTAGIDTLYLPEMTIPATTDATPSNQARLSMFFHRPDGALVGGAAQNYSCNSVTQYRIPTTTPTSWKDICTYNAAPQVQLPETYVTTSTLNATLPSCTANQSIYFAATGRTQSCLTIGSGLTISGGTLSTTGGTTLTGVLEAKNFKRDCGGVGDGSTNNAAAFESCIASLSDGDTLYLPTGNYKTNSQVLVNKRINLIGDGIASAITCNTTISVDCVVVDRGGSTLTETARIENLSIIGGTNSTRNGLVLTNFVRGNVRNVYIGTGTPSGSYGFVCEGCLINTFEQVVVSNSTPFPYAYGTPDGGMLFKGSSTYPSNANLIKNCIIEPGAGKGIFIDGATGTTGTTNNWIVGGTIEGATMTYGIHIKGANYFSVSNVHVEDLSSTFTKANIKIENSVSGFIGAGSFGNNLELVNADDLTIENLAINNLSVDAASQRNRFSNLTWNLSGTGTFADSGTESTYTGQLRNAGNGNASPTGPAGAAPSHNLLRNGGAEVWAGSNPTEWGVSSGTLTQTGTGLGDTRKLYGDYAVKVSGGTATTLVNLPAEELARVLGQSITITGWVYVASGQATQPVVALQVWYNGGSTAYGIAAITATDQWVPVRLTSPVPSNATQVQAAFVNSAAAAAGVYYVDGVSLTLGRAGVFTEAPRLPSGLNLALYNNGGYKTVLKPSNSASANLTFTLPAATAEASPTNADVMVADAGTLSFDKRAKFDSGPNLDYFPSWSNTNGTLSASGPLYKFGSDIVTTGHVLYGTTNTKDLGGTGNRPRNIYVGTSIIFPDGTTQTTAGGGGGGGISAISGTSGGSQTGPSIALAVGTSGTDITFPGSGNTLTLNVPDAGAGVRGVIKSTGSQTLAPNFTLTGTLAVQATTTARQINPEADNTYSLGTSALRWAEMHVAGSSLVVHGDNTNTKKVTYGYSGSTGTITADAASSIQVTTGANPGLTINTSGNATFGGTVTATSFSGSCASCTNITAANISGGTLAIGRGGTGITTTPSNGQVMIGNGSGYTAATLTATANQTKITNGSGSITLGVADAFDISGVTSTAPVKAGLAAATPSSCTANKELYIKTDATAGQQLFLCNSTGNGFNLVGDGGGGGGAGAWSALTDPTGSLSLAMAAYTTTFTAGNATSTNNVFTFKDTSSNSGTGYIVSVETAASSAAKPFRATVGGTSNGIEVNTSGVVAALGTGGVSAAALVTGTVPLARLSGITTTQLSASAAIVNSQLANSAITINGTSNQVTVSSSPVSLGAATTLSLPQNIHTAATPQFAALGLGTTAPTAGIDVTGKTLNTDVTNTVAAGTYNFSVTKNDTNTRVFSGVKILGTYNTGGSNANTTVGLLEIDTVNTSTTGIMSYAFHIKDGGATKFYVMSSNGAVVGGTYNGLTVSTTTGTLTVANSKTLTASNTLTFTGTDGSSVNFGAGGTVAYGAAASTEIAFGGASSITSSPDFTYTTATGRMDISKSLNSSVPLVVTNASNGAAAQARVATSSDVSGATIAAYSSGFTPSAGIVAGAAVLDLDGAAAIIKGQSSGTLRFLLGSTEYARLSSTGLMLGTTTPDGKLRIVADANDEIIKGTGYSLTGTSAVNMIDLAGTWNTTGAPTAIKSNITNTASDAASQLLDLQVGGTSKFAVRVDGAVTTGNTYSGANTFSGNNTFTGTNQYTTNPNIFSNLQVTSGGAGNMRITAGSLAADKTLTVSLNAANRALGLSGDVSLGGNLISSAAVTLGTHALTFTTAGSTNVTLPTSGTLLAADSTNTVTNKTIDAEGTGNTLTIPIKIWIDAAANNAGTAAANWDLPSSNAPAAAAITGGVNGVLQGVLDFADGATDLTAQRTLRLPSDWTGNIDVNFKWFSATTTGDVIWGIATACVADAETNDPSFNSYSDVTDTTKGTTNQTNDASISSITVTGCAAGELMHVKVARRLSQAGDTMAGTARLIGVELTYRRSM